MKSSRRFPNVSSAYITANNNVYVTWTTLTLSNRHRFRADWHDYKEGIYFVTICVHEWKHLLGKIINEEMHYSSYGKIVETNIQAIPEHHQNAVLHNFVVMPNHIHMIIEIVASSTIDKSVSKGCLRPPQHGDPCKEIHYNSPLTIVIRTFKAACSRTIGKQIWQRNYHEHIIRSQPAYNKINHYISTNVINWSSDCFAIIQNK